MNTVFRALPLVALAVTGAVKAADAELAQDPNVEPQALSEVVVTARRREERIQDVPIAITAFTEQSLTEKAIVDGFDLQKASPSLIASTSGSRADGLTYSMRGQSNPYGGGGASVVVYFADVPQSAGYAGAPFFDLASVQVLAGPQGTLFGQSSTGGAVLFAPRRPTNALEGSVTTDFGNLGYQKYEGVLNIPLASSLALRLAANVVRRDGFTHDITFNRDEDDQHEENWRLGVLFTPTEWFENYLVADGRHAHVVGTAYSIYQVFGPGLLLPSFTQALAYQQALGSRTVANSPDAPAPSETLQNWGLSNTAKADFGAITLKDIIGYRDTKAEPGNTQDGDGTPLPILSVFPARPDIAPGYEDTPQNSYVFSNELQVLGKAFDSRLDWIVGGFYSYSNTGKTQNSFQVTSPIYNLCPTAPGCTDPTAVYGNPPVSTSYTAGSTWGDASTRTSKAIFGQGTLDLSSWIGGLKFTAGYRYSMDDAYSGLSFFAPAGVPLSFPTPASAVSSHGNSYNLSLDYKLSQKVLVYIASRRGYRPGAPAPGLYPQDVGHYVTAPIQPETVQDLELGAKTDWAIGDLSARLDGDIYYSDYKNIQRQIASFYSSAPLGFNVAKAGITGVEFVASVAYQRFSLDANYAYTDAKYKDFVNPFPAPGQATDAADDPFGFVPKQKVNVSAHYEIPLAGNAGSLGTTLGYSWQGQFFYTDQSFNFPGAIVPSHGLVTARVDWSGIFGTKLTVALLGDNLTNKTYIENGNLDAAEIGRVFYGAPRTYAVELNYRFE